MADDDLRRITAAEHIANSLGARADVVYNNLQYATRAEIRWAANANDAAIRARAARLPDREDDQGKPVNPFWYKSNS